MTNFGARFSTKARAASWWDNDDGVFSTIRHFINPARCGWFRRVLEVRRQDYELAERQLETARRLVDSGARSVVEVMRGAARERYGVELVLEQVVV